MNNLIENLQEISINNTLIAENQQKVFDAGEKKGFEEGQKSEYDRFWDAYQSNGSRKNYQGAFYGYGWTEKLFKPKYDIIPNRADGIFRLLTNMAGVDLVQYLKTLGITLDFSETINFNDAFSYCYFGRIGTIDTTNAGNLGTTFAYCRMKTIDKLVLKADGSQTFVTPFVGASMLENLTIEGTIGQNGFNVQWSPLLSRESIDSILDCLKDFTIWTETTDTSWGESQGFPTKIKIVLNEEIENPTSYRVQRSVGDATGSWPSDYYFNKNGEYVYDDFVTGDGYGTFTIDGVFDSNGNTLTIGTDYNIYEGSLPSTSKTITFNATAVKNAYTDSEWNGKVSVANKNGWTIETV